MKLIDLYRNEQSLTMDRNGNIWIIPDDQYSFTSYPLPEDRKGCIVIDSDTYFGLLLHRFMFTEDLKGVTDYKQPENE